MSKGRRIGKQRLFEARRRTFWEYQNWAIACSTSGYSGLHVPDYWNQAVDRRDGIVNYSTCQQCGKAIVRGWQDDVPSPWIIQPTLIQEQP